MTTPESRRRRAMFMLMSATFFWASSFPVMKALGLEQQKLLPDASTWFLTWLGVMYRFGAAGLLLAIFLWRDLKNISRSEIEQGFGLAVFGVGGILFQMDGLNYTAASTSAFLTQCYCVFIPVWVALTQRRWPRCQEIVSVGLVMVGLGILSGLDFTALKIGRGELETLIASLLFTGQILWLERPRYSTNAPLRFSLVMFVGMAVLCVPGVWLTAPNVAACLQAYASSAAISFMAVLVLLCTLGGYLFMNRWQRDVPATEAGLIYSIEPVLTSVLTLFLPAWISVWAGINYSNEILTTRLLIGGGLVTVANVLLQKK